MAAQSDTTSGDAGALNSLTHLTRLVAIGRETDALIREWTPLHNRWWLLCDADHKDDTRVSEEASAVSDAEGVVASKLDILFDEAIEIPAVTVAELRAKAALLRHEFLLMHADRYDASTAHEPGVIMALGICADIERLAEADAELVALGRDYAAREAEQRAFEAVQPATTASCEGSDRINEQLPAMLERALASTAVTPDEISAKLAMLRSAVPYALRGLDKVTEDQTRLAWTVVRDLLAVGQGA